MERAAASAAETLTATEVAWQTSKLKKENFIAILREKHFGGNSELSLLIA
jgi:hypothetical protein